MGRFIFKNKKSFTGKQTTLIIWQNTMYRYLIFVAVSSGDSAGPLSFLPKTEMLYSVSDARAGWSAAYSC
jgi:hypothetical protein